MARTTKTFYDELGVDPDATVEQIMKAWKRLIVCMHPDKHPDEEQTKWTAKTQHLNHMVETLKAPRSRQVYNDTIAGKRDGRLLVLIDMNGSLLYKGDRRFQGGREADFSDKNYKFFIRPGAGLFLRRLCNEDKIALAIYTSREFHNASWQVDCLFECAGVDESRPKLFFIFAGKTFSAPDKAAGPYKSKRCLHRIWTSAPCLRSGERFDKCTTVNLDNEARKLRDQAENGLLVPDFGPEEVWRNEDAVLDTLGPYLVDMARRCDGDVRDSMKAHPFVWNGVSYPQAAMPELTGGAYAIDDSRIPEGRKADPVPSVLEVFGDRSKMPTAGFDFETYDAIPVQVTGKGASEVKPIVHFSDARLADALFENLLRCGYERPTPVQKYSIPIVISGRDLMACAQTGSGKTCAFMVPCLESLLCSGPPRLAAGRQRRMPSPCGLVLAPTRELALQIHSESLKFAYDTGIRCCIIYGGADMREQVRELEQGCDVLVATPGRLTDMCDRRNCTLELVQFFILDEADRMLDMGFEPEVREIVVQHHMSSASQLPKQWMMFSATFPSEVQHMAQDFLTDYIFIAIGGVGSASELINHIVVYADEHNQKMRTVEEVIQNHSHKGGLAVIFVETKVSVDKLELDMHMAGIHVAAIHGDRTQVEREEALAAFKCGDNPVLVATDVAARGLDIPNVELVINFDMPKQMDDYVHRIGRTGRAGRKGVAVTLVNERCGNLQELGNLLEESKQEIPSWFPDLCRNSAYARTGPGGGQGGGGRGGRAQFGGQDVREDEAPKSSWQQPMRPAAPEDDLAASFGRLTLNAW